MRNKNFCVFGILILVIVFAFSACQPGELKDNASTSPENGQNLFSTIKDVDFRNFTFYDETGKNKFTLKDGEKPFGNMKDISFALQNIEYADLTGDKEDEAIINILVEYGSGSSGLVYVYTLENGQLKKLWYAASGHDAKGGLKRVYSEDGALIIELFGSNEFVESKDGFKSSNEADTPEDLYRPTKFTKFRFEWNGEKFVLESAPELLDYDLKNQK